MHPVCFVRGLTHRPLYAALKLQHNLVFVEGELLLCLDAFQHILRYKSLDAGEVWDLERTGGDLKNRE
jgi:hypothetical protein